MITPPTAPANTRALLGAGGTISVESGAPAFAREYRRICEALARATPADVAFDARAYDPAAVARVRRIWRARVASEYESTSVFSQISVETMEANAPIDVTATVLRMGQDELRHAQLCLDVVAALGGDEPVAAPSHLKSLPRHGDAGPEERALRNIIYGCCLSETVNAARFVDSLDVIADPYISDATRRLLADEALHAQFGFVYLELWRDWLDDQPAIRERLGRFLRLAFAVLERDLAGANVRYHPPSADEAALGISAQERLPETFRRTVEEAIVPGLAVFGIDAEQAWRARSLG
jgi:hypothetical protein